MWHRDRERLVRPDWFQSSDAVGYVAYADLFAGGTDQPDFRCVDLVIDPGFFFLSYAITP